MSEPRQQRPRQRREGWGFPEAVRRYREQYPAARALPSPGTCVSSVEDAPAVQWQAAPEGDERRVCEDCASPEHARGTDGDG